MHAWPMLMIGGGARLSTNSATAVLLEQVLDAIPRDEDQRRRFADAWFDHAIFESLAEFVEITFENTAGFDGAVFQGDAMFQYVVFQGDAMFDGTRFQQGASFGPTVFEGEAVFYRATFQGSVGFARATFQNGAVFAEAIFRRPTVFNGADFQDDAVFDETTFQDHAVFQEVTFQGDARFEGTTFLFEARFEEATFRGDARFDGANFRHDARFDRATFQNGAVFGEAIFRNNAAFSDAVFERARQLGPLLARGPLTLDQVHFAQLVQIQASTSAVHCRRAQFPGGVQFRLRWARVVLDDTDLAAPSVVSGVPRLSSDELSIREQRVTRAWHSLLPKGISEQPQVLSLRRSNVAGLRLSKIDLADCRFAGAHNLDKVRLEADISFMRAPTRLGWDSRQVIAEERAWRAHRSARWTNPWWPAWLDNERPDVLDPGQIAELYRALRKGREDAKDEPGAGDFYYGEMEMRRHARLPTGSTQPRQWVVPWAGGTRHLDRLLAGLRLRPAGLAGACMAHGRNRGIRCRLPPGWLHPPAATSLLLDQPAVRIPCHPVADRRRGEADRVGKAPAGLAAPDRPGAARLRASMSLTVPGAQEPRATARLAGR
jgi:uncharacterized protein YjbI with pentapeptide repeats